MTRRSIPLQTISVAAPCTANWGKMIGNDQMRFCQECKLNVYNLSAMTQNQAEDLIRKTEGKLCVRYFRRADGTILTQNCPVGLEALKKKAARFATAIISALLSFITGFGLFSYVTGKKASPTPIIGTMAALPPTTAPSIIEPVTEPGNYIKGEMVIPTTETPKDELGNTSSSCSVKSPNLEEGVIMGKMIAPSEGFEMGDVATPRNVERNEKDLRSAAIESYEVKISNQELQDKNLIVKVAVEIDSDGNIASAEVIDSDNIPARIVEESLATAYKWRFDINKLKSQGARVNGVLTFHIK